MSYNEAGNPLLPDRSCTCETRAITITSGSRLETPAPVEPTGPKGRRRKGPGRTDYLLCVQVGDMPKPLPVGVLEAKKEIEDPLKGMQQAKGYADCQRFDVKYVFATNGHRYGEFDFFTSLQDGPFPFADFPAASGSDRPLCQRYRHRPRPSPRRPCCFRPTARPGRRPATIRTPPSAPPLKRSSAAEQDGEPARVLLSLATGSGKTIIATNLLWRLHAGRAAAQTRAVSLRPR